MDVVVLGWDAETEGLTERAVRTTVGRILFNRVLPDQMRFANDAMRRVDLKRLVDTCYRLLGPAETAHLVDGIKDVGFKFATRGGLTIGLWDIVVPKAKKEKLVEADEAVASIDKQFQRGLITEDERYEQVVELWQRVTKDVSDRMMESLGDENPVRMMTDSGARGNKGNIGQLGAMRGLMADPSGRIIDVPVRSNFREGMTVLEYFISTHGARKGLADTALRTADSGYLTRRLVDVAQDVITREDDCGTEEGSWIIRAESADEPEAFQRRLVGRLAAADLVDPKVKVKKGETAPIVVSRGDMISEELAKTIDAAGIDEVLVRSPLACESRYGVCRICYGRNLATGEMIGIGEAVGIIAAQSIGEPGTQLTMRTFHTGGVAGQDITQGLPRVEELFEARIPKGKAEISHIDGIVEVIAGDTGRKVKVISREAFDTPLGIEDGAELLAAAGDLVELNQVIARAASGDTVAPVKGFLAKTDDGLVVRAEDIVEREYAIPHSAKLLVEDGAGDPRRRRDHGRPDQPAGVPRHPGQGRRPALPGQGGPAGLPQPGRHDQRQAHRDHRPPDAQEGPDRPAGRLRAAADGAHRPPRLRGGERSRPRGGRRAGDGPDRAPRRDQGVAQHLVVPRRRLLPGDDPGAHRGRHQRRQGPPDRPQGERHHRQAHPGRVGRAAEHRRAQGAPAAGRPRGARRRGHRGPRRGRVQPVPRGRDSRPRRRDGGPRARRDDRRRRRGRGGRRRRTRSSATATEPEKDGEPEFNPFLEEAKDKVTEEA